MLRFDSRERTSNQFQLDAVYNGSDCCVTQELFQKLYPRLGEVEPIYEFTRGMQSPAMDMMLRGVAIDLEERRRIDQELTTRIDLIQDQLDRIANAVWGRGLNPRSPTQVMDFMYGVLKLPPTPVLIQGEMKLSSNNESLEKLSLYRIAKPICSRIIRIRELSKLRGTVRTSVDNDGRIRCSYNVAGTETGRWSSSENVFRRGTNLQNITPRLRRMFCADVGYKMAVIDLEQAESRLVGYLAWLYLGMRTYLDKCESSDLHTEVSKMIWPHIKTRADAEEIFWRHWTYRDLSKRGGHGSNYYGKPPNMARQLGVEVAIMEEFQHEYFEQFPEIPQYHRWVAGELQLRRILWTPFGRRRRFFNRPRDDSTLREAIAHIPQSTIGDMLNLGMYKVWRDCPDKVQLLLQVHDAIAFQYKEQDEATVIPEVLERVVVPITVEGKTLVVPAEAKVGWNWGYYDKEKNLDGLKTWKGNDDRRRQYSLLV